MKMKDRKKEITDYQNKKNYSNTRYYAYSYV